MDNPNEELLRTLLNEQLGAELDLLSQRVKAEQEVANELRRKNDLEEQALRNVERSRQAELQRTQLWLHISEQTANLIQQLPEIKLTLHAYFEEFNRFSDDVTKRLDRIEYALMLLLSGVKGNRVNALIDDIESERNQRLLEQHKTTLHALKMKQATYGKLSAPSHLQTETEDHLTDIFNKMVNGIPTEDIMFLEFHIASNAKFFRSSTENALLEVLRKALEKEKKDTK